MQIRLSAFVRKEILHILRDPRTMLVVLVIPVVLILLFGFTVTTDVNDLSVAVCAPVRSNAVNESVNRLSFSPYFRYKGFVDPAQIDKTLRTGQAAAVVVFDADYHISGKFQILLDGADVNTARTAQVYLQNIIQGSSSQQSLFEIHQIYNPQLRSSYTFAPGIMGMIFLLICAMMTSISIVREKETGTMEVLLVSPVKPIYIIISKILPYLILSTLNLATILILSRYVLDVPLSGGIWSVVVVSVMYLMLSLALGIMVSNIAKSQIVALLISAMVMIMPVVFFSGLLFPTGNIPWALRWVTYIIPARWYIDAMRKLMIEGVPFMGVMLEFGILLVETLLLMVASTKKFNDRLE